MDITVDGGAQLRAILPVIDMANHSSSPNVTLRAASAGVELVLSASASDGEEHLAPGAPLLLDYGRRPMREFLHTFGFITSCDDSPRECYDLPRTYGAGCAEVLVVETAQPPQDDAGSEACPSPFCLAEVELARRADSDDAAHDEAASDEGEGGGEGGEGNGGEPRFEIRYFVRRRSGAQSREIGQSAVDAQSRRVLERCRRRHGEGSLSGTLLRKHAEGEGGLTLSGALGYACSRLLDEQLDDGAVSCEASGGGGGGGGGQWRRRRALQWRERRCRRKRRSNRRPCAECRDRCHIRPGAG